MSSPDKPDHFYGRVFMDTILQHVVSSSAALKGLFLIPLEMYTSSGSCRAAAKPWILILRPHGPNIIRFHQVCKHQLYPTAMSSELEV